MLPARRRRPARQRRRRARAAARRADHRGRRRRRLLRRHQERPARSATRSSSAAPSSASDFAFTRKQLLQLASKMRFVSAQFESLLDGELWLENARHANAMAARLAAAVEPVDGVEITHPVEANAVFARLPRPAIDACCSPASTRSTSGTSRPTRCAGCAPGTRRPRTSTGSPPRSQPRSVRPSAGARGARAAPRRARRRRACARTSPGPHARAGRRDCRPDRRSRPRPRR